jgi:hypothetical protein
VRSEISSRSNSARTVTVDKIRPDLRRVNSPPGSVGARQSERGPVAHRDLLSGEGIES